LLTIQQTEQAGLFQNGHNYEDKMMVTIRF